MIGESLLIFPKVLVLEGANAWGVWAVKRGE